MPKLTGQVIKAVRVQNTDFGRIVGRSLKALRELAGVTQNELAQRLQVGQAAISKIEHRGDVQISSLQKYVHALGATLRIEAAFSAEALAEITLGNAFDANLQDDDQLVFPIFGDELFKPKRDVVLSVRPNYSKKIMKGTKTVELRRRFPVSAPSGTIAYIYSTSPVQAMVGSAEIAEVVKLPVVELWNKFGKMAQIERASFNDYFSGLRHGFALRFTNVRPFTRPIDLTELRKRFDFEPPQSFLYATSILRTALQDEYSNVPY
jgi:predicted transcriptional regulator/DNA-binding XRE family transcriptional regulator